MSRSVPEVQRVSGFVSEPDSDSDPNGQSKGSSVSRTLGPEFWFIRLPVAAGAAAICYKLEPFGFHGLSAATVGFVLAFIVVLAELRLRRAEISGLLGGILGAVFGVFAALLVTLIVSRTSEAEPTKSFIEFGALFVFGYLGFVLGSSRSAEFSATSLARVVSQKSVAAESIKLLDTSVLIDGRIADVCEAHFLDGVLAVPQFVLHELQLVADSGEGLKRQRGRRGLEVLQHLQKLPHLEVRVLDKNLPSTGDVDGKLVELARELNAKIITNDFNLNKVANVQGVGVLNVNQLANALKPVVLPGEAMRVMILREGKEPNQGVAFLDDGTMVVVDGGRRFVNKRVDVVVTSVHQSTAGKMIFGRLDEIRTEQPPEQRADAPASLSQHAVATMGARSDSTGNEKKMRAVQPEENSQAPGKPPRRLRPIFPELGERDAK
jgi:uncharacterized protein YacL